MDKEWLNLSRASPAYYQGVNSFLDFAFDNVGTISGEILCPCTRCVNCLFQNRVTVEEHLVRRGFASHYRVWTEHGEVEGDANRTPGDDVGNEGATIEVDAEVNLMPELARGPTMCASVWARETEKFVGYNNYGQMYIGAEREMTAWLGTLARKSNIFPIHIASFRDFTQGDLDVAWAEITKRYTTDHPLAKKHIFERLDNMWRCWRYELKQKYFVEGDRAKSLRNLNDPRVDKSQWEVLVNYWLTDEAKYIKDGKIRSRTEMYIVSRTHKDGTVLESAKGKLGEWRNARNSGGVSGEGNSQKPCQKVLAASNQTGEAK
ncbi:hypothetical protein RJ639_041235 [Escallonia herrerae]|uniref:Transposase-associated domain-containing protein n=1 Tax=Escallonia herrerae TaxID=1293975 RepID=A0AA88WEF6_9ASTE|nr:hypothetical protein RJ639_041235 [Escallonia herrerae]